MTKVWTLQFPISYVIEGDDCYRRIADAGIERVLLCSVIYSPYRLVMPRYPQRAVYSLEEGRYYYQPEAARYAGLPVQPQASTDFAGRDVLGEATVAMRKAGVSPAAWVTVFANGSIAKQHPDWAVQNLYGSADRLFLCPNHPEVREYSLRVCAEVAERYDIDELMLDKIPQTCLELNAFAGRIDPVLRTLGSFCFCEHCQKAALSQGLDLARFKTEALRLATDTLTIAPHLVNSQAAELTGDNEIPLLMLDNPWLLDILRFRIESIKSFLVELRERLARPALELSLCFVPHAKIGHDASSPRAWLAAQSYEAYRESPINTIHSVVHWDVDTVEYNTRRAVNAVAGSPVKICTHLRAYGATNPAEIGAMSKAALRGGADGLAYFCHDLMTEDMLKAIGEEQGK